MAELLVGVAHGLNNPLPGVFGYLQMLQGKVPITIESKRIDMISLAVDLNGRIVKSFLVMFRQPSA